MTDEKKQPDSDGEATPAAGESDSARELDLGDEEEAEKAPDPDSPVGVPIGVPMSPEEYRRLKRAARAPADEDREPAAEREAQEDPESD